MGSAAALAGAALGAALLLLPQGAVGGPDRLAVVVGNQNYDRIPDLANARGDAERMAGLLREMGFTVFDGYDVDRAGFETLMRRSILNADPGAEIVFFYAGHGIQIGRRNYLLPQDVAFESIYDLPVESVTLDRVIEVLSAKGQVHVAIIDACRENPFPDTKLAGDLDASLFETRTGFDVFQTPINSLVAFSTTPGQVAFDGEAGGHSPYTAAILDAVAQTPRENVTDLFARVRETVFEATEGRQVPWESSTLVRPFRFLAAESGAGAGEVVAGGGGDAEAVGQETPALPDAVTLAVEYDRTIPFGADLAEAVGRTELPPFAPVGPAENGFATADGGLVYAPTLSERRGDGNALTVTDSFTLETAGGDRLDVTLEMDVNACDLAAGDALDPGGVGFFRLPNELDIEPAGRACRAAVAAEPDEPRFRYQLGRVQQAAGAYEAALESFEAAMEAGHVRALNATARLLTAPQVDRDLFDVPEDRARALELLERGVAAADPFAMHLLGRFLLNEGSTEAERERGFELLDRAAELGHTYSMNELGIYFLSEGSEHFLPERGLRYLEASAARQDIYGYHNLGYVALYGLAGGEPDYAEARRWFERAAEGGHPGSPATLGRMIVRGEIDAPARDAVRWYDLGLERGDPWGGVNAANMILNDEVSGFSDSEALVRAAKAVHLPGDEAIARARAVLEAAGRRELARAIQRLLNELGADVAIDGLIGPATRAAIAAEAEAAGLERPGDDPRSQLSTLAQAYWAANPIRSDVF